MIPPFFQKKKHTQSGSILMNVVLTLTILAVGVVIVLQAMDLIQLINT